MKVSDKEYDKLAKAVVNGKIGIGDLPKRRRKTFYVLVKAVLVGGQLEPEDLNGGVFSSFEKANKAMRDDWNLVYQDTEDAKNRIHDDCVCPFESDDSGWLQFDDGELEYQWHIGKVKLDE